ncbi:MAG: transglutaminase domain-containing protein [Phycisphaerales bacterium]|nr:transglutaminase domain-containing protein [Phycisphaerales bacterium]
MKRAAVLIFAVICWGSLSNVIAVSPQRTRNDTGPTGAEYEVTYHHTVRNKMNGALIDVQVYLPVPQSDAYQQISDFEVENGGGAFAVSDRTDAYGTKIKRVTIAKLEPGAEAHVGFSCVAKLSPPATVRLDRSNGQSLDDIPREIREKFTIDHPIFGLQTPAVQNLAVRLMREHPNPVDRAKAIHDLVAGTLKYNREDGWDPAPQVMERGTGSCSEFSFVFCALCRATGIPTRFAGGSIFPLKSEAPFEDKAWHRWAEAYLPGHGWTAFDTSLDRGKKAQQDFVGVHHPRVLILTRLGTKSLQLGGSYIGANSHSKETTRSRTFIWTQGTRKQLAEAVAMMESGKAKAGRAALQRVAERFPGTWAAQEARRRLIEVQAKNEEQTDSRKGDAPARDGR